jgi:hypothetical protein
MRDKSITIRLLLQKGSNYIRERDYMFTLNEVTYYEEADISTRVEEALNNGKEWGASNTRNSNRADVLAIFKTEANSTMTEEDALDLFNRIAIACGWDTAEASDLRTRFRAEITLFGYTVLEIEDIEADDEDEAKQKVEGDISFDEVELRVNLTALGENGDYRDSTWELDDFLQEHLDVTIYEA